MRRWWGLAMATMLPVVALGVVTVPAGSTEPPVPDPPPALTEAGVPDFARTQELAALRPELPTALAEAIVGGSSGRQAEAGSPTVTVTPPTDLVHGQTVTIRGRGWRPGAPLVALQCAVGVAVVLGCELLTDEDEFFAFRAGSQGRFGTQEELDVVVDTSDGPVDCRTDPCQVLVGGLEYGGPVGADVAFDPAGPDPTRYGATATPDTGLVDGDQVTVDGTGFPVFEPGWGVAQVHLCREPVSGPGDCDPGQLQYAGVRNSGQLEGTIVVTPVLEVDGGPHDCRIGACSLAVQPEDFTTLDSRGELSEAALVPIAFDPAGGLRPPPTLTVTADAGLLDGDAVRLQGSGFDPGRGITVAQCRAGATTFELCEGRVISSWFSSDDTLDGYMALSARIEDWNGHVTDCRITACSVIAGHGDLGRHAEASVAFDPAGELLDPSIAVTPATDLADGDDVVVTGTGWPAFEYLDVLQCAPDRGQLVACAEAGAFVAPRSGVEVVPLARTPAETANTGADFRTELTVRAQFRDWDGAMVDCRVLDCVVVAEDFGGLHRARAPIRFRVGPISATPPFTG